MLVAYVWVHQRRVPAAVNGAELIERARVSIAVACLRAERRTTRCLMELIFVVPMPVDFWPRSLSMNSLTHSKYYG